MNPATARRAASGDGKTNGRPRRSIPGYPEVILFNKPFGVLCQFSPDGSGKPTLGGYMSIPDVYPAGRLDADSEGLVVLTADGALQARITSPDRKLPKVYWVEVEGTPDDRQLAALASGVELSDGVTAPAEARGMPEPEGIWPRDPPIRWRKTIPTSWLLITVTEGRNRQVRRMTAAVGLPTLRLVRYSVGPYTLDGIAPGHWRRESGRVRAR